MAHVPLFEHYQNLAGDDASRGTHARELVTSYYELMTDLYLAGWGESHHFAPLDGGRSLTEALEMRQMFLAERAQLRSGMEVLDVGSGVGGPAMHIAQRTGAHVTGLDLSRRRLAHARELAKQRGHHDRTAFVHGDAMQMPFKTGSFDVAYSLEAICHTADKGRVHNEAARVLKPGGLWIGYDWLAADWLDDDGVEQLIDPICRYHAMPYLSTPRQLTEQLQGAGFTDLVVGDAEATGNLSSAWDHLDRMAKVGEAEDVPPVVRFMCEGARALTEAARRGAFLIEFWQARKP
ncbi:methyltransferase domain-containing protein [Streptomyces sp. b94]|uniref:class I SAM-dependent methyltransferase n=1 Tax=Streptomyces sp. b94 TaxID=1827634 RepID=UPI001B37EB7A|nr:class I SAM-dependent methyltransferase [Streptomyces sp. b94]MBQ1101104.1 methyltransferase domain-containing protein [Streptomyces sp. b94]